MKKKTLVLAFVSLLFTFHFSLFNTANAQLLNYGFRAGAGIAQYVDVINSTSPIVAFNLGGFVNFGFTGGQSLFAENFMLQSGLNLVCRGSNFKDVMEMGLSMIYDEGSYHAWYLQVPILATVRYELLLRQPGHYVLFQVGPAVSFGLFGSAYERMISPYMPQRTWNFEKTENVFDKIERLDIGAIVGVGYERNDLSVMLHLDYGFKAVSEAVDVIKTTENETMGGNSSTVVPKGNNLGLILTVGYQIPIR